MKRHKIQLPIVIIGPLCSGKTTVSKLLAEKLSLQYCPLDSIRWYYYVKNGMNIFEDEVLRDGSFRKLIQSRAPYDFLVMKNALEEFKDSVIDCGVTHSFFEDAKFHEKIIKLYKDVPNIITLLPTEALEESVKILNARLEKRKKIVDIKDIQELNKEVVISGTHSKLSKSTVYTNNKTFEQVVDEIVARLL